MNALAWLECLARVPDPRDPRGVRHTLTSLLLAAVAAVLAGARSFTAIGEWVADAPPQVLASLGSAVIRWPAGSSRRMRPPSAGSWKPLTPPRSMLRWGPGSPGGCGPLARDPATAGERGGRWPWTARRCGAPAMPAATGRPCTCWRSPISRPARCSPRPAWTARPMRSPAFAPLLEPLDLAGCVITADALHTQREHAEFLVSR